LPAIFKWKAEECHKYIQPIVNDTKPSTSHVSDDTITSKDHKEWCQWAWKKRPATYRLNLIFLKLSFEKKKFVILYHFNVLILKIKFLNF
jgi:hypothetical protein